MKRIQSACICQVLRFMSKEDVPREIAERQNQEEVARYKAQMDRAGTQYRIEEETRQPDGSVIVKIIKQYNNSPVGDYLG